jgi:hypothetical protein
MNTPVGERMWKLVEEVLDADETAPSDALK